MSHKKSLSGWSIRLPVFVIYAFVGSALLSCENSEGIGGTGSISGSITEQLFNDDFSEQVHQRPAVDEEVFILFGEEQVTGDRILTGYSGGFRFDFLYPGRYYIYYRSEDSASFPDDKWSELIPVDLEKGEEVELGELVKLTTLDYDEGAATISGVVRKIKYVDGSSWPNLVVEYVDFAHEQEVYITYGGHEYFDQRVRTQYNGVFEFRNLIPGDYLVFLYSEDVTQVTEHVVIKYEVTITEFDQVVDLGTITVEEI